MPPWSDCSAIERQCLERRWFPANLYVAEACVMKESTVQDRINQVVPDIIAAIRDVLRKHQVTFEEYRVGFHYLLEVCEKHEMPLLLDLFLNQTICDIEMQNRTGTRSNVEGPYFLPNAPYVTDHIKVRGAVEPMLVRGVVKDTAGNLIPEVEVDLWFASPDGYYSGYADDFPVEYFRGKLKTDRNGRFEVMASVPGEYPITHERHGPTGTLIELLGGQGWRPRHLHQKYSKEGFQTLTTQAYFTGTSYLDVDPVGAVFEDLIHTLKDENGMKVLDLDIVLDPIAA